MLNIKANDNVKSEEMYLLYRANEATELFKTRQYDIIVVFSVK